MGQITVRKLDDELIRRLKARAAANNRSAEAEVRSIIESVLGKPAGNAEAAWEGMARLRKELEGRWTGDSTELIREGRDYLTRKYE